MNNIPRFGKRDEGQTYRERPGAYGVGFDERGRIGVVFNGSGNGFLPGGGIDPQKSPEQALRREVIEECGFEISLQGKIGEALEYFQSIFSDKFFKTHGHYYEIRFEKFVGGVIEDDHQLVWLNPAEAVQKLHRDAQAWIVKQAFQNPHNS